MSKLKQKDKKRILSVLSQHFLLFGSGMINYNQKTQTTTESLITSLTNSTQTPSEINSIISIIRQHSLLFGHGIISANPQTIREDGKLIQNLLNTLKHKEPYIPRYIPRVNYLNFKRKLSQKINIRKLPVHPSDSSGLPLFGNNRIPSETIERGYLILFSNPSKKSQNTILSVHIVLIKQRGKVTYKGETSIINSDGYIHTIIITKSSIKNSSRALKKNKNNHIKTIFNVQINISELLTIRTQKKHNIYVTSNPYHLTRKQILTGDPAKNQFAFFFPLSRHSFSKVTNFLTKIIKRATQVSDIEADNIAYFITKRIFTQNETPIYYSYQTQE